MNTKFDRWLVLGTVAIFFIISMLVVGFSSRAVPKEQVAETIKTAGQPVLGSPSATVDVVIFEDLKCVWCAHFSQEVFPKLKTNYIDTGKIRYTIVLLAFLPGSKPAGNAAMAVYHQDPSLFFPFVETVYAGQPPEDENWAKEDQMKQFAAKVPGIDMKQMLQAMKMGTYTKELEANYTMAQEIMKSDFGTPTIYINGARIEELDYPSISAYIDEALHA